MLLKHDLKTKSEKMKQHKNITETKCQNRKFGFNPNVVCCSMKCNTIKVNDMP